MMTRLSEITFINSASFDFAQVQVEGNTLFCGANGVGKTTILRAILYFYSANSKRLGINSSKKKKFVEYYFENLNSYIIYKYKNEHGINYIVLYKTAQFSPVKFRFFTSYEEIDLQNLFLEDSIALSFDKIVSKIRASKINISNTINTAKEYRDIIYGQTKEYRQFALLKANSHFNQIHKTISNIFINSKLDSDVIKKSLVSDIEDFIPIDLQNISVTLGKFLENIQVIEDYEKNEENVKGAISNYNGYFQKEQLFLDEVNKLFASAEYSTIKERQLNEKIKENKEEKNKVKEQKEFLKANFDKDLEKLKKQKWSLEDFIKKANKKKQEYKNIEELLLENDKKTVYESKKNSLEKQIENLKQKGQVEASRFETLISNKQNETKTLINELNSDKNKVESDFLESKNKEEKQKDKQNKKLDEFYKPLKDKLKIILANTKDELHSLNSQINLIKQKEFLKDEIQEQSKLIQKTKDEISKIELKIQKQKTKMSLCEQDIQKQENIAQQEILRQASSYDSIKKDISRQIDILRKRLNIEEDSFLKFLRNNKEQNLSKIVTLLKDEILFSKDLNPLKIENSDTLYGYQLDIKEDKSYDELYLKEEIANKNTLLQNELKNFESLKEKINKDLEKTISKIYKEKDTLNQSIDKYFKEQKTLESKLFNYENEQENLEKKAKILKEEELKNLQSVKNEKESKLNDNKKSLEKQQKEYQNKKVAIKSQYSRQINLLNTNKEDEIKKLDSNIKDLEKDLDSEIKELKSLKNQALLEKGVDTQTLDKKSQELLEYQNKLQVIEQNLQIIFKYNYDKEEYFDKLKDKKLQLKELIESIDLLKNKFKKDLFILDEKLKDFDSCEDELSLEIKKYQENLKEFQKIKEGAFYLKIKALVQEDYKIDKFVDISNMQAVLFSIDNECDKKIKSLRAYLNKVFAKLKTQNILNLQIPLSQEKQDLLKSAKDLKEFYEQNKIKYYKDTLSSTYSMTLNTYTKQISDLLDASGKIKTSISKINQNLQNLQNINVIQKVELRYQESDNKVVQILKELKDEYNNNSFVNEVNLFNPLGADNSFNNRIIKLFSRLSSYLFEFNKKDILDLEDSFILEFRAVENGHDTGFVSVLDDVGSNGTDVMIKVMVYIAMLNLSRKSSQKDKNDTIYLHCILDEIGILSPRYLKELIAFANSQKIEFLNGAPDEKIVTTYKRVYLLNTTQKHKTMINEIIAQI